MLAVLVCFLSLILTSAVGVGAAASPSHLLDAVHRNLPLLTKNHVGSFYLNDEATFVDVVSSCSSLDAFHCPLAGFVLVGSRAGDVLLLSREGTPALEVAGPEGASAVRVVRVVQTRGHRLPFDVLLVASFNGVPGLHGLLLNHRTMEVAGRWMMLSDAVRDVADVRLVSSTLSADRSQLVLPSVAVLSGEGDAYVGLDVHVGVIGNRDGTYAQPWPLHLVKLGATHVFASYKFGLFVVAGDDAYRIDRQTLSAMPLPCWTAADDSSDHLYPSKRDDHVEHVAFDDVFHELHVSSLVRTSSTDEYTLRRHKFAPGTCIELHSTPLMMDRHTVDHLRLDHLSSSGGYSLVTGSGVAMLYNHSAALVHDQPAPWDLWRFVASFSSEVELVRASEGKNRVFELLQFARSVFERLQQWVRHAPTRGVCAARPLGFETRISIWGPLPFLYRNTMVVVSSSRRTVELYRPPFRAVIGKASAARSKELSKLAFGIAKSFGLLGAGVFGLALSKRKQALNERSGGLSLRNRGGILDHRQHTKASLDAQLNDIYAEYKRERDAIRAQRRRKVPVAAPAGLDTSGLGSQEKVDYAPSPSSRGAVDPEIWMS